EKQPHETPTSQIRSPEPPALHQSHAEPCHEAFPEPAQRSGSAAAAPLAKSASRATAHRHQTSLPARPNPQERNSEKTAPAADTDSHPEPSALPARRQDSADPDLLPRIRQHSRSNPPNHPTHQPQSQQQKDHHPSQSPNTNKSQKNSERNIPSGHRLIRNMRRLCIRDWRLLCIRSRRTLLSSPQQLQRLTDHLQFGSVLAGVLILPLVQLQTPLNQRRTTFRQILTG